MPKRRANGEGNIANAKMVGGKADTPLDTMQTGR